MAVEPAQVRIVPGPAAITRDYQTLPRHHRGLAGPAWRHVVATGPSARHSAKADARIRDFIRFTALRDDGRDSDARRRYPDIFAAEEIQADTQLAAKIKVMVLADLPGNEIADRLVLDPRAIETWEALYFDVRDLREATSWLAIHVVGRERTLGNRELAAVMKLAIAAGAVAIRLWFDAEAGIPLDEADRLFARSLRLAVKADEAINMPLESESGRLRFLELHARLQIAKQRLQLDRDRLTQRCTEARHRHELALLRAKDGRAQRKPASQQPKPGRSGRGKNNQESTPAARTVARSA